MRVAALVAAVLAGLAVSGPCGAGTSPASSGAPDQHPVRAELIADRSTLAPGESLKLGVLLRMDEAWHTYWAFSGDAGLPTQVSWHLPPGLEAGPLRWPGPHKYEEAGGLTVYGYADEVLLISEVTVSDTLTPGRLLQIAADVSWLVCRQICIPGDTSIAVSLEVTRGSGQAANGELFTRYGDRVPSAFSADDPVTWTVATEGGPDGLTVEFVAEPRGRGYAVSADSPDLYPLADESFHVQAETRRVDAAGRAVLGFRVQPYGGSLPSALTGVLVFRGEAGGDLVYRVIEADLEPAMAAPRALDLRDADFTQAAGSAGERSLAIYLLMAAIGGLILNLMPCVLPVISLKVLSFVSQAGEESVRIRHLGLAFSAGIVSTFVVLALIVVAIKTGGQQIGWGFQFQAPGFVIFLAGLVFVLSLSLFGVVTVRLPGGGGGFGALADREGLGGSFFNGVLATILATPCTAPFLGAALGFAFTRSGPVTVAIFTASGVGMATPYLLLALRPGWTAWLPRPGAWMERFKQAMGFPLMATVLWLLWVLGKQLGMEAVVWTGAFLLALGISAWLVGQWLDLRSSSRRRKIGWVLAVTIAVAAYGYFVHPLLQTEAALARAAAAEGRGEDGELAWEPYTRQRTEELLVSGRPVFINFTAEWCWTCKVNERTVLADAAVRRRFDELDVALVKADWTSRNPDITALLRAFGRSGVPLYVIFPANRPQEPIVLPEIITPARLIDALDEAVAAGAS